MDQIGAGTWERARRHLATLRNEHYGAIFASLAGGKALAVDDADLIVWRTGPIFDSDGWVMPGTHVYSNFTGVPERVLPPGAVTAPTINVNMPVTFAGPPNQQAAAFKAQATAALEDTLVKVLDRYQSAKPGG